MRIVSSPRLLTQIALGTVLLLGTASAQRHPPKSRPTVRIRPWRPVVKTESTRVKVKILDGVADTTVAIKFRNDGPRQAEKILILPLPKGATADRIEMEVGGKLQKGELLTKQKALQIYSSIVRSRKDPALLEYYGQDLLRLRVFPIPSRGTQLVTVRFRLLLPESGGLSSYEFPTRAIEGGSFSMEIELESSKAMKNVYSPLSGMDISRNGDYKAKASFECKGRPQRDPILFYGLSDRDFGLNLLTYKKKGQKEGYFLLMLAPKRKWDKASEIQKSVTFVIDTSGSMQGKKIEQAKGALRFFLQSLNKNDRFNLVPFSTEARPFATQPVIASKTKIAEALAFVTNIEARGGTNIHEALNVALAANALDKHVPMLVFLTDGLPTVGETNIQRILADSKKANRTKTRIFVFGVGKDVNTKLLDQLSADSGGTRDYVADDENIEVKTSALFEKLAHPVMTDLELEIGKISWNRLVPRKLGDLFRGSRLVLAGRYLRNGATAITLKGKIQGREVSFVFDAQFPAEAGRHDFVATIWAQKRIGQLLDAIRRNGQRSELIEEITRIGKEHGIVTPYTSQLIIEEGAQLAANLPNNMRRRAMIWDRDGRGLLEGANQLMDDLRRLGGDGAREYEDAEALSRAIRKEKKKTPGKAGRGFSNYGKAQSGEKAVEESKEALVLAITSGLRQDKKSRLLTSRRVRGRVFHLIGGNWVDAGYKKAMAGKLREIEAFSEEYFKLLQQEPKLARFMSFSTSIVLVIGNGQAVWIQAAKTAKATGK